MTRFKGNLNRHQARKHVEIDEKIKSRTCQYYYKKIFSEIESDQYLMKRYAKKEIKPVIDSSDVVKIMSTRPGLSNRDITKTLAIVRDKLGKQKLKPNLRNVIRDRSNLLKNDFINEDRTFIKMNMTNFVFQLPL